METCKCSLEEYAIDDVGRSEGSMAFSRCNRVVKRTIRGRILSLTSLKECGRRNVCLSFRLHSNSGPTGGFVVVGWFKSSVRTCVIFCLHGWMCQLFTIRGYHQTKNDL